MLKRASIILIAGSVVTMSAACSSSGNSRGSNTGDKTVEYLVVIPEAGTDATLTGAYREGIAASVAAVNATGGIRGRKVVVTYKNDAGEPSNAVSQVQASVSGSQKPDLVWAGTSSTEAAAIFPLSTRYKFVAETPGSSSSLNNPKLYPYAFSTTSDMAGDMQLVINTAKARGVNTLGVVVGNNAYGANLQKWLGSEAEAAGIKLVQATFSASAVSMTSEYARVLSGHPQMLFVDAVGSQVPSLLTSRVNAGGVGIPTIAGQGVASSNVPALAPGEPLKNLQITYWNIQMQDPSLFSEPLKQMVTELHKAGTTKLGQPIQIYALGYDGLMYYRAAVEQAETFDATAVAHAMENLRKDPSVPWVTWAPVGYYTPGSHFPDTPASAFGLHAPAAYNTTGTIKPPGGAS